MDKANVWVYDALDRQVCKLKYVDATHKFGINGDDELTVRSITRLTKRQKLVWHDADGWHEHEVDQVVDTHDSDGVTCVAYCINSLCETIRDHIEQRRPSRDVAHALSLALENSRWEVGACDDLPCETSFYHQSARECIEKCVKASGGELVTRIETDGYRVTRRRVSIVAKQGDQDSPLRFSWRRGDFASVEREELPDEVYSRVYPRGRGEETTTGGYGRRLTIADVNDGAEYVEDPEAQERWGRHDGSGGRLPSSYECVFEECKDPAELKELGLKELAYRNHPHIAYRFDAAAVSGWEAVHLGDSVAVVDHGFDPPLRLRDRVVSMRRSLATGHVSVELGEVSEPYVKGAVSEVEQTASMQERSVGWDAAADASPAYAGRMQESINKVFESGGSYVYQGASIGIVVANGTLNPDGSPKSATLAIQLKGGGFRISDAVSGGKWVWKTFGTGAGFYADEIVAGKLSGKDGKWWVDLDRGTANFDHSTTLSGNSKVTETDAGSIAQIEEDRQVLIDQNAGTVRVGRSDSDHLSISSGGIVAERSDGTKLMELLTAALSFYAGGKIAARFGTDGVALYEGGNQLASFGPSGVTLRKDGKVLASFGADGVALYKGSDKLASFEGDSIAFYVSGHRALQITSTAVNFYVRNGGSEYLAASYGYDGAYLYAKGEPNLKVTDGGLHIYDSSTLLAQLSRVAYAGANVNGPALTLGGLHVVSDGSGTGMIFQGTINGPSYPHLSFTSGSIGAVGMSASGTFYGDLYGRWQDHSPSDFAPAQ